MLSSCDDATEEERSAVQIGTVDLDPAKPAFARNCCKARPDVMANRSNRGRDEAAVGSSVTKRPDLYGFSSADFIRASGHANRVKQPDT